MKKNLFNSNLWKKFFILPLILLMAEKLSAQHYFDYGYSEDSVVLVTATANCYNVKFTLNIDSLTEENYYELAGNFSVLTLPKPYMYNYLDIVGSPMLPHRKVYLQVPEGYDDPIVLSDLSIIYEYIDIKYPYYPYQMIDSANSIPFVVDNSSYLHSPDWTQDNRVEVSPYFNFFDERGFCLDIYPYSYDPINQRIRVIKKLIVSIPINFPNDPTNLTMCCGLKNYLDELHSIDYHYNPGRILIVTPQVFTNTQSFSDYINIRNSQGHDVVVHTLEDIASYNSVSVSELTVAMIKNDIQSTYMNIKNRYLILIGNKNVIPYASGVSSIIDNPESDFDYTLPNMSIDSSRVSFRMAVGRWPVAWEDTVALRNIIYNVLDFEESIAAIYDPANLPVNIVSGTGNHADLLYEGALACRNLLQKYNETLYDGRNYLNCGLFSTIESNIIDGLWSLVYRGHGSTSGMGKPLCIYFYSLPYLYAKIPPMVFSFACSTNGASFGSTWTCSRPNLNSGASAFFGSTTDSYAYQNNAYSASLFNNFRFAHLGDAIAAGSQKFYTKNCINDMKRYVLMGDPVMHVFGQSSYNNNCYAPKATRNDVFNSILWDDDKISIRKDDSKGKQVCVYTVNGCLMLKTATIDDITFDTTQWPSGVYLIVVSDENNVSSHKYIKK